MIRKCYIRYREDVPDNANCYAALDGFRKLGVETAPFYGFGDINDLDDLGHEVGLHGFVGDVHAALDLLGEPRPPALDYPEELREFLGRKVWRGRLGDAWASPGPIFVKPVRHKEFTGHVHAGAHTSQKAIFPAETPVWLSEVVQFIAEYRCFVLDGEVIDVRRYNGHWGAVPAMTAVSDMMAAWGSAPAACAFDVGVTRRQAYSLLVECNDAFALGHYGLDSISYAKMIAARWEQMVR